MHVKVNIQCTILPRNLAVSVGAFCARTMSLRVRHLPRVPSLSSRSDTSPAIQKGWKDKKKNTKNPKKKHLNMDFLPNYFNALSEKI